LDLQSGKKPWLNYQGWLKTRGELIPVTKAPKVHKKGFPLGFANQKRGRGKKGLVIQALRKFA